MKNSYEIRYSYEFYNDFEKINSYIKYKLKNVIAANKLINRVEREIINRSNNPLDYEKFETNAGNIYYRIYIGNYIVFYTVSGNVMEVRRIIYNKRNFSKLI